MQGSAGVYRFGPFVLERPAFRVLRGTEPLALSPKLVDLLLYFVSRPSILVTKEELLRAIWPDVAVTDNALSQAVSDLRQALGDDPSSPQYIQTVARRGYRFIAPVESVDEAGDDYRPEMAMNAHDGAGFARLVQKDFEGAREAFGRALDLFPDHARSHVGMAACWLAGRHQAEAGESLRRADASIANLARTGRLSEAALLTAFALVVRGRSSDALVVLDRLLTEAPPGFPGWTIPIDPPLEPLRGQPAVAQVLARLADRAR